MHFVESTLFWCYMVFDAVLPQLLRGLDGGKKIFFEGAGEGGSLVGNVKKK